MFAIPSYCWRANDLQRMGIPVRRIFLWVLSSNINSACVRDHISYLSRRMGRQYALYRRRDVSGWRQPAREPRALREKKPLLEELQHSEVRGLEDEETDRKPSQE